MRAPKTKGPSEFVTKPFSVTDLRDAVRRALATRPVLAEPVAAA
jgi:FixJ family two-component response regulator